MAPRDASRSPPFSNIISTYYVVRFLHILFALLKCFDSTPYVLNPLNIGLAVAVCTVGYIGWFSISIFCSSDSATHTHLRTHIFHQLLIHQLIIQSVSMVLIYPLVVYIADDLFLFDDVLPSLLFLFELLSYLILRVLDSTASYYSLRYYSTAPSVRNLARPTLSFLSSAPPPSSDSQRFRTFFRHQLHCFPFLISLFCSTPYWIGILCIFSSLVAVKCVRHPTCLHLVSRFTHRLQNRH